MKNDRIRFLSVTGLLVALVVLMGLTPIGLLHVGPIYVTLLCIPVIVGTLLLGLEAGILLGFTFGSVSFYVGMTAPSPLVMPVVQHNMLYLIVLCYFPRLLLPLICQMVYRLAGRGKRGKTAVILSALAGSLTNTVLYLGLLLIFYIIIGLDHMAILGTLSSIVLFAGIPEAIAAAVVAVPVISAINKAGLSFRYSQKKENKSV
jgi:uncharacterized membrane protein